MRRWRSILRRSFGGRSQQATLHGGPPATPEWDIQPSGQSSADHQSSQSDEAPTLVDIGGYRLAMYTSGSGKPTIVLDAGYSNNHTTWDRIQPACAETTRVISYDRAGNGASDWGPAPRTSAQFIDELRRMLTAAEMPLPYVLVGHSMGGLNAQLYAARYPLEVAALVLIDPLVADLVKRVSANARILDLLRSDFDTGVESGMTYDDFVTSCEQVSAAGSLPPIPIVVLTATQPQAVPREYAKVSHLVRALLPIAQAGQAALVRHTPTARQIFAQHSHHYIHQQEPDLVIQAIRDVISQLPGGR
jgi:pimeloyl-ACP methyl ester carboxylesterase